MKDSLIELFFTIARKKREDEIVSTNPDDNEDDLNKLYGEISFLRFVELYRSGQIKDSDIFAASKEKRSSLLGRDRIVNKFFRDASSWSLDYPNGEVCELVTQIESFERDHVGTSFIARTHRLIFVVGRYIVLLATIASVFGLGKAVCDRTSQYYFVHAVSYDSSSPISILLDSHVVLITLSALISLALWGTSRLTYYLLYGEVRHGDRHLIGESIIGEICIFFVGVVGVHSLLFHM
jgi:hypothetical protein